MLAAVSRVQRRLGRRPCSLAVLGLVLLTGCGDTLGPGASPEPEPATMGEAAATASAHQALVAAHFKVPLEVQDALGIRYRLVPPGTFRMGSPVDEEGRSPDEAPVDVTLLVPSYLQATEATWAQVRRWRPTLGADLGESGEHPAHGLSHEEVGAYLVWLNEHDVRWYHRLPSEAEWERACRAESDSAWSGGVRPADLWAGVTGGGPRPVGRGQPNAYGLYDLHGNVAEWCRPWYAGYPTSAVQLPTGPVQGEERVVRGGSWRDPPNQARAAARAHLSPTAHDPRVGFRVLLEAGYGVPGLGPYRVRVQSYGGAIGTKGREVHPGVRLRLVSVPERLTARQEDRVIRWRELEGATPLEIDMLPGRYYVQAWRMAGEHVVRGPERKFTVPDDLPEIDVEIPPG